jgi:hypothetical protein
MQISNPSLSQLISSTYSRNNTVNDRNTVRPVTIEGQVIDDEPKKNSQPEALQEDSENSSSQPLVIAEENQNSLIQPVQQVNVINENLLIEQRNREAATANNQSQSFFSSEFNNEQGFPFGNRRSANGLTGTSLAIQSYLNNSPENQLQSSLNFPGKVDYFV